jgi:predicted MPP superfamily phosphohydrolase
LIEDLTRGIRYLIQLINNYNKPSTENVRISRLKFFSYLALTFSAIPLISLVYGVFKGAYKYKIHRVSVKSPKLPKAFNGLKIVQISDLHTGSFVDNSALEKAFQIVLDQKPDVIFFTGDLVNNKADETKGFLETYIKLKAPMGVFSITGNHDYGDYSVWPSDTAKKENFEALKKVHADAGWRLLMNEHIVLERGEDKIAVIGIENWGGNLRFPKYGKLKEAHTGTENYPFKLLLSHDPSHWDKQVSTEYKDIDITFSGHTHGMQFGIEIPGFKWSPVKLMYQEWADLYKEKDQHLYVNRGFGFIGYPGRFGMDEQQDCQPSHFSG